MYASNAGSSVLAQEPGVKGGGRDNDFSFPTPRQSMYGFWTHKAVTVHQYQKKCLFLITLLLSSGSSFELMMKSCGYYFLIDASHMI